MNDYFGEWKRWRNGGVRRLIGRRPPCSDDYTWFDHPEMQARIARAEADLREGRVTHASSLEELMAQLNEMM
jgi:hypothetical protein